MHIVQSEGGQREQKDHSSGLLLVSTYGNGHLFKHTVEIDIHYKAQIAAVQMFTEFKVFITYSSSARSGYGPLH